MDEVRRGGEDRSTCDTSVDIGTACGPGYVLEEQCTWICSSGTFL